MSLCFLVGLALVSANAASPLDPAKLGEIDDVIQKAIAEHRLPGAVVWVEHGGEIYWKAYGQRSLVPTVEPMTRDTVFDAASLTKVLAGTPAMMLLVERGKVDLDAPVSTYIPEYTGDKGKITVRELMTHTSGLPPGVSTRTHWHGTETALRLAVALKLQSAPGTTFRYSDINFFTVGEIVARVSGMPLDKFCAQEIYGPLKMTDTGFLPPHSKIPRIAPTEMTGGVMLRGTVHDPTARFMGGVAGHAGLFTTAPDMARFARMMLNMGELDGVRIFQPETVKLMTSVQTPPGMEDRRGLGWDIDSGFSSPRGQHFPLGSYGHTGFTGTALWIDPFSKTFFIFLSNRVHPDGKGSVISLYRAIGTLAAAAVTDFSFDSVAGALPPLPATPANSSAGGHF
jgi:CubicO group peptidase (beta-lactamase class C family)